RLGGNNPPPPPPPPAVGPTSPPAADGAHHRRSSRRRRVDLGVVRGRLGRGRGRGEGGARPPPQSLPVREADQGGRGGARPYPGRARVRGRATRRYPARGVLRQATLDPQRPPRVVLGGRGRPVGGRDHGGGDGQPLLAAHRGHRDL